MITTALMVLAGQHSVLRMLGLHSAQCTAWQKMVQLDSILDGFNWIRCTNFHCVGWFCITIAGRMSTSSYFLGLLNSMYHVVFCASLERSSFSKNTYTPPCEHWILFLENDILPSEDGIISQCPKRSATVSNCISGIAMVVFVASLSLLSWIFVAHEGFT